MALTSTTRTTVSIPDESTNVEIRKLSFRQLEAAQGEKRRQAIEMIAAMGDALDKLPTSDDGAPSGRAATYDRFTVLKDGIVAWTYAEALSPDAVGDLDEPTAQFLFDQIMDFSVRGEAEGKGSAPSSGEPSEAGAAAGLGS